MNVNVRKLVSIIKNYRSIALGSFVAMSVLVFLIGKVTAISEVPALQYAVFFASLFVVYLCVSSYRKSRINMINSVLYDGCDPENYVRIYGEFIGRLEDADINTDIGAYDLKLGFEFYWLELCEGMIALGEYDDALSILNDLASVKPQKQADIYGVSVQYNICTLCLKLGRTDEAENHLDSLIKAMAVLSAGKYKKYEKLLKSAQYSVNIAKGEYDYAENAFNEAFEIAEKNYEKVKAKHDLGSVYIHFGDIARAKEAFEYVITNGNKLHVVEEARQQLKQLG